MGAFLSLAAADGRTARGAALHTILILAASTALLATTAVAASTPEQDLVAMEARWAKAMVDQDLAAIDKIVAPDWTGQDSRGKLMTKSEMMTEYKTGKFEISAMANHDVHPRVMGDMAVVQGADTETSSDGGKDTSGVYTWTDVYQRRGGQWVVVASQVTPVKK